MFAMSGLSLSHGLGRGCPNLLQSNKSGCHSILLIYVDLCHFAILNLEIPRGVWSNFEMIGAAFEMHKRA